MCMPISRGKLLCNLRRPAHIATSSLRGQIRRAIRLADQTGDEVCGLLVDDGQCLHLVPIRNIVDAPASFEMCPRQVGAVLLTARLRHHEVVGTYHSHPGGTGRERHRGHLGRFAHADHRVPGRVPR